MITGTHVLWVALMVLWYKKQDIRTSIYFNFKDNGKKTDMAGPRSLMATI